MHEYLLACLFLWFFWKTVSRRTDPEKRQSEKSEMSASCEDAVPQMTMQWLTYRPRVRRNAKGLTTHEVNQFIRAVKGLKKTPSATHEGYSVYDLMVMIHRDAFENETTRPQESPRFLPWYREFLRIFEEELQRLNPSVTIPYWDFSADTGRDCYLWKSDFLGGDGDPEENGAVKNGPFRKDLWKIEVHDSDDDLRLPYITRNLGSIPHAHLPDRAEVQEALSVGSYDVAPWNKASDPRASFRNFLEGWRGCERDENGDIVCLQPSRMHNAVHLWVGGRSALVNGEPEDVVPGTMITSVSPNDPVFWLVHANVDRIWAEWQQTHGEECLPVEGGPEGCDVHDVIRIRNGVTVSELLNTRNMGYVYDTLCRSDAN